MSRLAGLFLLVGAIGLSPGPAGADTDRWIADNRHRILHDYVGLLSIPNVAGDLHDIRRNADHLVAMLGARGLEAVLLEGEDPSAPPAVFAEWRVPGATRTLVFYAHYDGQPVSPEDWSASAPFEPVLWSGRFDEDGARRLPSPGPGDTIGDDWRLYGRSASDDKSGVMAILAGVEALRAAGRTPTFNLKIFLEGEEEAGSPNLRGVLARHRDLLASDGWIIMDGPAHPSGLAQVVLGVRGATGADITVYGPNRPLHSGHYGNWAPNPAMLLSQLLASMKDVDGRVTIAGFYDDMIPLTPDERAAVAAAPGIDEAMRAELGLARTEGGGRRLAELVTEPSLTVTGLRSAEAGALARKVIPATASATLDIRLVKGDDPRRQFERLEAHIRAQGYHIVRSEPTADERRAHPLIARVVQLDGYGAERVELGHELVSEVVAAVRRSSGAEVVVTPTSGGSLPLYIIREQLGAPSIMVGFVNPDNNQHAEDENIRLGALWDGVRAAVSLLTHEGFTAHGPGDRAP